MRRSVPGRAVAALVLLVLLVLPSLALAQPRLDHPDRKAPAERSAAAGLLTRLWSRWTHLWGEEGSILDPNGRKPQTGAPGGGATPAGDTGSGLDPDGK